MCARKLLFITMMLSSFFIIAQKKALVGGTLIDGFGGKPLYNSVILIDNDKITAVGHQGNLTVPKGYDIISTEGMSVMPGLWDMHVHLMINGHSDYTHWDRHILIDLKVSLCLLPHINCSWQE